MADHLINNESIHVAGVFSSISVLKAFSTSGLPQSIWAYVEESGTGEYFLDLNSSEVESLPNVVLPNSGLGRWIKKDGTSLTNYNLVKRLSIAELSVDFPSLTASTVPYLNSSKQLTSSAVTPTELGYLSGVTSSIQPQIEALASGLFWKEAVRVTTTAAAVLATDFENGDAIDGITLNTGDRILIKNQSVASENGIYVVNASGAPSRSIDFNTGATHLEGATVAVLEGTVNVDTRWSCTTPEPITFGSTAITFVRIGDALVVSDVPYDASWNGVTSFAPSKNAVYDKLQALTTSLTLAEGNGIDITGGVVSLDLSSFSQVGCSLFYMETASFGIWAGDGGVINLTGSALNLFSDNLNFYGGTGTTYTWIMNNASGSVFTDGSVTPKGIEYGADYSATFSNRSLVDKGYVDGLVIGLWDDRGNYDASGNVYPSSGGSGTAGAILKGDIWTISVAGVLGGSPVNPGDVVRALVDSPASSSDWAISTALSSVVAKAGDTMTGNLNFADTIGLTWASGSSLIDSAGTLNALVDTFRVVTTSDVLLYSNSGANNVVLNSSGINIHDLNGNTINLTTGAIFISESTHGNGIGLSSSGITINDGTTSNTIYLNNSGNISITSNNRIDLLTTNGVRLNHAAFYDADYSSSYTSRSLIDLAKGQSLRDEAKTYADSLVVGLWDDRGNYNASGNVFPSTGGSGSGGSILKGDIWTISVAGTLGTNAVTPGDTIRALVDFPGTAAGWAIAESNIGYTPANDSEVIHKAGDTVNGNLIFDDDIQVSWAGGAFIAGQTGGQIAYVAPYHYFVGDLEIDSSYKLRTRFIESPGGDVNINTGTGAGGTSVIIGSSDCAIVVEVRNDIVSYFKGRDFRYFADYISSYSDRSIPDWGNVKSYANSVVVGLWDDRGAFDASVNAYPSSGGSGAAGAIVKGDIWTISVGGTLPTGQVVEVGDTVRALIDTPGNTQANWSILQNNIGYTPLTNVLSSAKLLVGNSSNVATAVDLSGEGTITNAGVLTLSNSAVTGKVLTGYSSGAGTVASADTILGAIQKLNGNNLNVSKSIIPKAYATSLKYNLL